MRNLTCHAIGIVMTISLALMLWMLYTVMAQPMVFAAEKQELLKPGYIPQAVERPRIDSKRFSRLEGTLYDRNTGTTSRIELRSYRLGSETIYTGRIGRANVTVEPEVREALRKED